MLSFGIHVLSVMQGIWKWDANSRRGDTQHTDFIARFLAPPPSMSHSVYFAFYSSDIQLSMCETVLKFICQKDYHGNRVLSISWQTFTAFLREPFFFFGFFRLAWLLHMVSVLVSVCFALFIFGCRGHRWWLIKKRD